MKNTISEAQKQFSVIKQLLAQPVPHNEDYFTHLSIASEEAYVLMNQGMCTNVSVCHECAGHRDFIRSMLEILGELEINAASAQRHTQKLTEYSERINKILKNIALVLAS